MSGHSTLSINSPGQLKSVQALRALAALMVAIAHASEEAQFFFGFSPHLPTEPLGKGVDLFFVISGFIIYYSSIKLVGAPNAAWIFIKNRLLRVVPLYYIFTTLMVVAVVFIPSGVKEARFDVWQIVSSYLFLPYERYDGRVAPILSLGWTLNYEMFFYALFGFAMLFRGKWAVWIALGILVALASFGAFSTKGDPAPFRIWTSNIILEFGMGILVGLAYERWGKFKWSSATQAACVFSVGLVLLYVLNLPEKPISAPRFLIAGVPAALMMISAVLLLPDLSERKTPRLIVALGDSSYSLYLSHRFIQRPIQIALNQTSIAGSLASGLVYVFLAVSIAVVSAHLVYLMLERPLLRWLRSGQGRDPASVSAPVALGR